MKQSDYDHTLKAPAPLEVPDFRRVIFDNEAADEVSVRARLKIFGVNVNLELSVYFDSEGVYAVHLLLSAICPQCGTDDIWSRDAESCPQCNPKDRKAIELPHFYLRVITNGAATDSLKEHLDYFFTEFFKRFQLGDFLEREIASLQFKSAFMRWLERSVAFATRWRKIEQVNALHELQKDLEPLSALSEQFAKAGQLPWA